MDNSMLKDLLEELDTGDFDMDLTGYTENAIEDLMTQFHVDDTMYPCRKGTVLGYRVNSGLMGNLLDTKGLTMM